jgi:hypothetical protein
MTGAAALLLLAALRASAASAPAAPIDPLQVKAQEWAARGFRLKDRVAHPIDGLPVAAAVYGAPDGSGDRFEAYVVVGSTAYLGYSHPSRSERLELDTTPAGQGFRDILKDGSRIIAYHATLRALNASSLEIVRYTKFHFSRVGSFPEGLFVQDGDETLVLSRDLPLGRFLSVACSDFGAISQTVFRTRLYAPSRGRFVEVTDRHPRIFAEEIRRKEAALDRLRGDLQKNAGEYLGLALSLYYDYAAVGRRRKGWERQRDFFQVPAGAPGAVKSCFDTMRADMRGRLGIPADWP